MLENYKSYLLNKMQNKLNEIKNSIAEKSHYYFNFIDDELFGILESEVDIYIVVLNSYKDVVFKLKHRTTDYKRFFKDDLKNNISKKSYNKLVKRGLYMNLQSGKMPQNSYCSIQRLTACLRENIIGLEVDHIDENPLNNEISNLSPQLPIKHHSITTQRRLERKMSETYITL